MAPPSSETAPIESQLESFKRQRHSLRISVSNLAALVGFHPYKQVPELVQQLVYQGSVGQLLLRQDAELLGLVIVSPQQQLEQVAQKAGSATRQALEQALTKTSDSVEAANVIKTKVLKEATKTGKLQATELKLLQEGVRSAVDTKHGTWHEDAALDVYEQQTGWPVRERNAQVKSWAFATIEQDHVSTVTPMGPATCAFRSNRQASRSEGSESLNEERNDNGGKRPKIIDLTDDDGESDFDQQKGQTPATGAVDEGNRVDPPFLYLLGSIDGLRDELAENAAAENEDDDSWILRPIVVECKHRMNRIHKVPPLYEQIQTVAYCFMHDTEHADLLQVMRRETTTTIEQQGTKVTATNDDTAASPSSQETSTAKQQLLTECFAVSKPESSEVTSEDDIVSGQPVTITGDALVVEQTTELQAVVSVEIAVTATDESLQTQANAVVRGHTKPTRQYSPLTVSISRISLDDPIFQHRLQWCEVVLPRLRSMVEAVASSSMASHF
ncbi:hypothetical protein MPSEU_000689300 [Mayamaea pseudoterrestris]|nr:hypothetical protein MPSEU_000689300 [Mayamaea pseudoterrestris]